MNSNDIVIDDNGGIYATPRAEVLIVLLHAYTSSPRELRRIAEVAREEYEYSDIYVPKLPVHLFSCSDPNEISRGIVAEISRLSGMRSYREIILVGHSLGAVLARKVWALAHGATPAAGIDPHSAQTWAPKIRRIVLLAATNRGWMISSALHPLNRLAWTLGTIWGNVCQYLFGRTPVIFCFRRGAPFLTQVRLQCLAVSASLGDKVPLTIQLLGTADDYVAPTDNLDLATGREFSFLEVSGATHRGIIYLNEGDGCSNASARFRLALKGDAQSLAEQSVKKEDVFDLYEETADAHDVLDLPRPNLDVRHVVFIIHGIRDRGFWTRRIARQIKSTARGPGEETGELCRTVTSTYGYFPMGPFLLPWIRRGKVEWLLDQYVTARSIYPNAKFSYIGHSNGTYLLANALTVCPAISFKNIVFCGSVVRSRFNWGKLIPQQVGRVINYVATADLVVAVFPHGLERMRLQDLGGAGHNGFMDPAVTNFRHVAGGHGAALVDNLWKEMAEFVLDGDYPANPTPVPLQSTWTVWAARLAPIIWVVIAAGVLGIGAWILSNVDPSQRWYVVLFVLYLYALMVVLRRA